MSDSLWSVFSGPTGPDSLVSVNVRSLPGQAWRSSGLVVSKDGFHAAFPVVDGDREELYSANIGWRTSETPELDGRIEKRAPEPEVAGQVALVYGRGQSYDSSTGTLSLEVRLANRGNKPIGTPIHLRVKDLSSRIGNVSILNADNGLTGRGAIWDLSPTVVGNQIPAGSTTYSSFTLLFRIDIAHPGLVITNHLRDLTAVVLTFGDVSLGLDHTQAPGLLENCAQKFRNQHWPPASLDISGF
jgi:hypothetical protein